MFEKETVSPSAKLRILQDNLPKKKNSENNVNVQLKDKSKSGYEFGDEDLNCLLNFQRIPLLKRFHSVV